MVSSVRCFLIGLLAAAPLFAGDHSWTPLPSSDSDRIPGRWVLTSDPAVSYADDAGLGVQRSDDGGRRWRSLIAPGNVAAVDPQDPDQLFVYGSNGVYRSDDGGRSWVMALAAENDSFFYGALLVARHALGRVYVVAADGLYRSADGGVTFGDPSPLPAFSGLPTVQLAEGADGGLYLFRRDPCGVHGCGPNWRIDRSPDHGKTWTSVLQSGAGAARPSFLLPHPGRPETLFVAYLDGTRRSDDYGATFSDFPLPGYSSLVADPSLPGTLYLVGNGLIQRSLDDGATWQERGWPPTLGEDGRGDLVAAFGRLALSNLRDLNSRPLSPAAYVSTDGGAGWTPVEIADAQLGSLDELVASGPQGRLYAARDRDLARSDDGGATWEHRTMPGLIFDLTGDPLEAGTFYASSHIGDVSGLVRSLDGGDSIELVYPTTSGVDDIVAFPSGGATTVVATLGYGELARSSDGGATWTVAPPAIVPAPAEAPRFEKLVFDGHALFAVERYGGVLYGSADGGATWSVRGTASELLAGGGGVLATFDEFANQIRFTTTGGPPWQSRDLPFEVGPDYLPPDLEVDREGAFYLLSESVCLRSRDFGRSWQSLSQDFRGGSYFESLVTDAADADRLYLGSSQGLFTGTFRDAPPLALLRGRFEARVGWRTSAQAPFTWGSSASVNDQGGVFNLFSAERAEVAVQVLDGRHLNGHFWFFVASMTDVELEIEVTDRITGDVWQRRQSPGQAVSFADLAAFPRTPQPAAGGLPQPFGGFHDPQPQVVLSGRFAVTVKRPAGGGEPVPATGRKLFGDTAGFTFFDPGAFDLIVNVIDGRALNGKFWVFGGSLTDQEFEIRIEDTLIGAVWTRRNPPGAFLGFGDTNAF